MVGTRPELAQLLMIAARRWDPRAALDHDAVVVEVDGKRHRLDITNLVDQCARSTDLLATVERWYDAMDEILGVSTAGLAWDACAHLLRVQLYDDKTRLNPDGLVRELAPNLRMAVLLDLGDQMCHVARERCAQWRVSPEAVFERAIRNVLELDIPRTEELVETTASDQQGADGPVPRTADAALSPELANTTAADEAADTRVVVQAPLVFVSPELANTSATDEAADTRVMPASSPDANTSAADEAADTRVMQVPLMFVSSDHEYGAMRAVLELWDTAADDPGTLIVFVSRFDWFTMSASLIGECLDRLVTAAFGFASETDPLEAHLVAPHIYWAHAGALSVVHVDDDGVRIPSNLIVQQGSTTTAAFSSRVTSSFNNSPTRTDHA